MTGSGKTGLGIAFLEEAGLNKIPAIIIDPKGDMSDLMLTFPKMSGEEFLPWIDAVEAERTGKTPWIMPKKSLKLGKKAWRNGGKHKNASKN